MNNKVLSWVILLSLAIVWGSSFILIKKGLLYFSSLEVGALRIVITYIFLIPLAAGRIRELTARDWKYLAIVGIIGSGAPAFLFALAQTGIDSNLAGILNSLTPLFTLFIGLAFFNLHTRWFNIAGVIIALVGAAGLISVSGGRGFEFNIKYAVFVIIATICYAINVNVVKAHLRHLTSVTITVFSFFLIGPPVLIFLLAGTPFIYKMATDASNLAGLGYLAILSIVGTALALFAFNKLIKMASPVFASSVTYIIPVVAVIWGVIDGEPFEAIYALWIVFIVVGVFLVNYNYRRRV